MKVEKLSTNCYRVRKTINKKTISMMFDHYPSDVDIAIALAEKCNAIDTKSVNQTMEVCFNEYITIKSALLSPSTIRAYKTIIRTISDGFKAINIKDLTQANVQLEITNLSADHSAKTVHNIHGFISAVLSVFRPQMELTTTLPQKLKYKPYTLKDEDIKLLLDNVPDKYAVAYKLGVLGMRRSEICALDISDIKKIDNDYYVYVHKAKVQDEHNKWVIKELPKTEAGERLVNIPTQLYDEIMEKGYIFEGCPSTLYDHLKILQRDLKLPSFRFHDLRVYYASYSHACGIPEAVIMYNCGWGSEQTMKRIYRQAMENDVQYFQKALATDILQINEKSTTD